jgi:apolipoprotein D and lipocalin family protein
MIKMMLLCLAAMATAAVVSAEDPPLEVVRSVDLERYLGTWYEIASYPAWFQRGCTAVTAEYSRRDDGLIRVVNSCNQGSLDGKLKQSTGRARVVEGSANAKLEVSFFWPIWGDYWIIDLDPEYRWAVVGVPSRKFLWILSRTRGMDESLFQEIAGRLQAKGYDPSRLNRTLQPEESP